MLPCKHAREEEDLKEDLEEDPSPTVDEVFATVLDVPRVREGQRVFADRVDAALTSGTPLLAELPTGTGKTNCAWYAHCVGRKQSVVVAGLTNVLQTQYVEHAARLPGLGKVFAVFGRESYPCYARMLSCVDVQSDRSPLPDLPHDLSTRRAAVGHLLEEQAWCETQPGMDDPRWRTAAQTRWRDAALALGLSKEESKAVWHKIKATDECECATAAWEGARSVEEALDGCRCPRARASLLKRSADLVVCNMPYVCTLAAVGGLEGFLEDKVVVWDEAHMLPKAADAIYERVALPPLRVEAAQRLVNALTATKGVDLDASFAEGARGVGHRLRRAVGPLLHAVETLAPERDVLLYDHKAKAVREALRQAGPPQAGPQAPPSTPLPRLTGPVRAKVSAVLRSMATAVSTLLDDNAARLERFEEFMDEYGVSRAKVMDAGIEPSDRDKASRRVLRGFLEDCVVRHHLAAALARERDGDPSACALLQATFHLCDVRSKRERTLRLTASGALKQFRRIDRLAEAIGHVSRAADYETWRRTDGWEQAPVVGPAGISFVPSARQKADALREYLLFDRFPPMMMSATLRDTNGSFANFEAAVGFSFGSHAFHIPSPFLVQDPWRFFTPSAVERLHPLLGGGGKERQEEKVAQWVAAETRAMAAAIRLAPVASRPLTFVVSLSHELNRTLKHHLRRQLPQWRHVHAEDDARDFAAAIVADAFDRPVVLYGCESLATGVDRPGLVNMVVLPKPLTAHPPPAFEYEVRYKKQDVGRAWDGYLYDSITLFRQAVGRIVRNDKDRGVVLFYGGYNASKGTRSERERRCVGVFFATDVLEAPLAAWPW